MQNNFFQQSARSQNDEDDSFIRFEMEEVGAGDQTINNPTTST